MSLYIRLISPFIDEEVEIMKRNIALIFIPLLVLSSCGVNNKSSAANDEKLVYDDGYVKGQTMDGHTTYYAKRERVHEGIYDIKDTSIVFANESKSDYYFLLKDKSDTTSAKFATFCQGHIYNGCGANLTIKYGEEATSNDKVIVINNTDLMEKEGLTITEGLELKHGFTITRKNNAIYVYAPGAESIQLAAIRFCNCLVGYDCLGNSTYIYEKNGVKVNQGSKILLPDFEIKEIPDGQARVKGVYVSSNDLYDMGYSTSGTDLIPVNGTSWHNCLSVLPISTYGKNHPKWYSSDLSQVCYTAHGDAEEFDEMAKTVSDAIAAAVINPLYKDYYRTGFFQSDGTSLCSCSECMKQAAYYGDGDKGLVKAHSAAMIKFMNKVADYFYEDSRIKGTDRENVNLGIFAYQDSCQAPISHIDEVQVNEKITIYIAPSRIGGSPISWTEPILPEYGGVQESQYNNLINWGKVSSNFGFWGYSTLFQNYLIPFATFESMVEDARVAYDIGATWIEFQNEFVHDGHTGFTMFKNYINSKTLIDVNYEYNTIKDTYFRNFYGEAGEIMLTYFDELEMLNRNLRLKGTITGYLGQTFSNPASLYTFESVKHFADLIDQSLAKIASLESSDPYTYNKLKTNIEYEAIFPHYFLTVYYASKLNADMTNKYRAMLYEECSDTKFTYINESAGQSGSSLFTTLFKDWGF